MKTYGELYLEARKRLKAAGIEAYSLEAREILAAAAGKSREAFIRDSSLYVGEEYETKISAMLDRRLAGDPVAYITGEWEFYGLPLHVTPDVLIPRPDTEVLVDTAKELLAGRQEARVLDLCAGSGCVGLAIASAVPPCRVVLADISQAALHVCRLNVLRNHMTQRVAVVKADLRVAPPMLLGTFDLVATNPPYIPTGELQDLDVSVRDYEPMLALDGGEDGLDFYRALARSWKKVLRPGGFLLAECGMGQAPDVRRIFTEGGFFHYKTVQDSRGIDRVVVVQAI